MRVCVIAVLTFLCVVMVACSPNTTATNSAEGSASAVDNESPSSSAATAEEATDSTTQSTTSSTTNADGTTTTDDAATSSSATSESSVAANADERTTTLAPVTTSTIAATETTPTTSTPTTTTTTTTTVASSDIRCLVYLHGKGGAGGSPSTNNGIVILSPNGNGTGWGGLQWEYDTNATLQQAIGSIVASIDEANCGRVVIHGFSNGASMTAALQCSGNTLGGRLVGVVIDDPVTDSATSGCSPATGQVALYWTGALANAAPVGTQCAQIDWTCAGGEIRGIDAYAADLGVSATPSPHSDHQWNFATQLPFTWLG